MIVLHEIDVKENYIKQLDENLLSILLKDKTSGKNIIWATDNYASKGTIYESYQHITSSSVTGRYGQVIKPRINKSKKEQQLRIKHKAEVFTPSWICNAQNNLIDNSWFGKESVFNIENDQTWITNTNKIVFSNIKGKTWKDYVKANRLEISCGEAPYLISRYDTVTGQWIDVKDRIGILDRKLRIVNENTVSEGEWYKWVIKAYQSIFAFEWQGDSLLIARENLLFTFIDYYVDRFKKNPTKEYLTEIAQILSWNIWQMDGLKFVIPNTCKPTPKMQMSFFEEDDKMEDCIGCKNGDFNKHTGTYCKVMNWSTKKSVEFRLLIGGNKNDEKF